MAVHLPVSLLERKLALRSATPPNSPPSLASSPVSLHSERSEPAESRAESPRANGAAAAPGHVIVNTELSMFGAGILPMTRFDRALDAVHPLPGFQPLEQLVSGRYLGEVARLVLVEGVERGVLFGGVLPEGLAKAYGLDTEVLARVQAAGGAEEVAKVLEERVEGVQGVGRGDAEAVRRIVAAVARRAEAVVAGAIFAMRGVRDGEGKRRGEVGLANGAAKKGDGDDVRVEVREVEESQAERQQHTVVACTGSVIQLYPGFMEGAQEMLDVLCGGETGGARIELCIALESSLVGAAVGAAITGGGRG